MIARNKKLVILSHNPLISVMVPIGLVESRTVSLGALADAEGVVSVGALTGKTAPHERRWDDAKGIIKLVMQISHTCNLTCAYCITDAGKWGEGRTSSPFMSTRTAAEAVRFFAKRYGSIGTIYLFGGEPTLNLSGIRAVCDETEELFRGGVLAAMPDIGFTSNGVRVDEALIRLLLEKPYLKMSVSIDGPAPIHDHFRIDAAGRPTYRRITHNIHVLRERTGRPGSLEITYSPLHQKSGMSLWDIMQTIHADTGVKTISVEIAYNHGYSPTNFDPLLPGLRRDTIGCH